MSVPKRRRSRAKADKVSGWPTDGDITIWQLIKLILFGERKHGNNKRSR